ncbi:MAG: ParA family protein [Spirochaetaceae bacterium]|jgi:chromosome partitioning protein|nr:ParA family protein [Spirochaetaceae bacterium]
MSVYVFVNQKGGVGKTTSAINIGAYLAAAGKKTLLVDFDSQANLSSGVLSAGVGARRELMGIYEALSGMVPVEQTIQNTKVPNLFVIPASIDLSGAAVELIGEEKRDYYLKDTLSPIKNRFDHILIDCPPSLGVLTVNGLTAADQVLIPMQCEYFALEGLTLLLETVKRIQGSLNSALAINGIFFTMYDSRTKLAQQVVKQVGSYFRDRVFTTIIPRNVRLAEAPSHGVPISLYDPSSTGALAYKSLAAEVLLRAG